MVVGAVPVAAGLGPGRSTQAGEGEVVGLLVLRDLGLRVPLLAWLVSGGSHAPIMPDRGSERAESDVDPGGPGQPGLWASMRNRLAWATNGPLARICRCRLEQPGPIGLHREAGHDPDHQAQEVHHGADVVEDGPEALMTEVHHAETGRLCLSASHVGVPGRTGRKRPHQEGAELRHTLRPDLLGEVGTARSEHSGDLLPPGGDGMAAGDQIEAVGAEGERGAGHRGPRPRGLPGLGVDPAATRTFGR